MIATVYPPLGTSLSTKSGDPRLTSKGWYFNNLYCVTDLDYQFQDPRPVQNHVSASSTNTSQLDPPSSAGTLLDVLPNATCERRLGLLETFRGDSDAGYIQPPKEAVGEVRNFLTLVYSQNPKLSPPLISPTADGEVILSWRKDTSYLIISFFQNAEFEWSFKATKRIHGTGDARSQSVARTISAVISFLHGDIEEWMMLPNGRATHLANLQASSTLIGMVPNRRLTHD